MLLKNTLFVPLLQVAPVITGHVNRINSPELLKSCPSLNESQTAPQVHLSHCFFQSEIQLNKEDMMAAEFCIPIK
jgi:hypothetical protein